MIPTREWVKAWVAIREQLSAQVDLQQYFSQKEVGTIYVDVVRLGLCSVPSGELLVRDPCCYLDNRGELPYFVTPPVGKYPVELAMVSTKDGRQLCAAARLIFNYRPAVHFEQALIGKEYIEKFRGGYFGFFSDSGYGSICDEKVHQIFCDFVEEWRQRYPNANFFEQMVLPGLKDGFGMWQLPGTSYRIPIFRTGWGKGEYPVYWGQDEEGRVCQMVVWMMDLEHPYREEEAPAVTFSQEMEDCGDFFRTEIFLQNWSGYFENQSPIPVLVQTKEETAARLACRELLEKQYFLLDTMMTALTDRYPFMQLEYGHMMSDNAPEMPNIADKNAFSKLLFPKRIVLSPQSGATAAAFSCTWDKEEGFGIIVQDGKAAQTETEEIVFQPEKAEKMTEEKGE